MEAPSSPNLLSKHVHLLRTMSPGRRMMSAPGVTASTAIAASSLVRQSAGAGLRDGFLRERVVMLEDELKAAQKREGLLEEEAKQVGLSRGGEDRSKEASSMRLVGIDPS
jgi:hypothetical protein